MINSHQFQQAAKQFRAGRISLKEFTDLVIAGTPTRKPNEQTKAENSTINPESATKVRQRTELSPLPKRPAQAHKGDFGRVLVMGGSVGMAGAVSLTGLAVLRSGTGLAKILVPEKIQTTVASFSPCLMTIGAPATEIGVFADNDSAPAEHAQWADVVALGPGLGRTDSLHSLVASMYAQLKQPMIVDADGLNVLADANVDLSNHAGPRILTPHPGEFQRLARAEFANRAAMESEAARLADNANVVVVLKGHRTFVTDGVQSYRNESGNPGMATAGAGDVLTGIISSLVGQRLPALDAAILGVHLHGVAGDFAAEEFGETSLIATDIIHCLPAAFKAHANGGGLPIGFQSG